MVVVVDDDPCVGSGNLAQLREECLNILEVTEESGNHDVVEGLIQFELFGVHLDEL